MKQWEAEVISHICQIVNVQHLTIEQTFASVDTNGDGKIDLEEFVAAMKSHKLGLTKQQYYDLFSSLDVQKNGSIEIKVGRIFTLRPSPFTFLPRAVSDLL